MLLFVLHGINHLYNFITWRILQIFGCFIYFLSTILLPRCFSVSSYYYDFLNLIFNLYFRTSFIEEITLSSNISHC